MSCKHKEVVDVFEYTAVCLTCGEPVCRNCRRADCKVFFWTSVVEHGLWRGRALSREDAVQTLGSHVMLCRYRSGKPVFKNVLVV